MLRLPYHISLGGLQDNTTCLEIYSKVVRFHHGDYKGNDPFKTNPVQKKKKAKPKKQVKWQLQLSHLPQQLPASIRGFPATFPSAYRDWRGVGDW